LDQIHEAESNKEYSPDIKKAKAQRLRAKDGSKEQFALSAGQAEMEEAKRNYDYDYPMPKDVSPDFNPQKQLLMQKQYIKHQRHLAKFDQNFSKPWEKVDNS